VKNWTEIVIENRQFKDVFDVIKFIMNPYKRYIINYDESKDKFEYYDKETPKLIQIEIDDHQKIVDALINKKSKQFILNMKIVDKYIDTYEKLIISLNRIGWK
jgi:hypothetical protein